MDGSILVHSAMGPQAVVISGILAMDPAQVSVSTYDHPRRLQLRATHHLIEGPAIANLHVSPLGVPAPHRHRDQQPCALPARADHPRREVNDVKANSQKRQRDSFSFLSNMRLHGLLGERRLSWNAMVAIGNFADSNFPAGYRRVGAITPPLGLLAACHAPKYAAKQG
jgi:hypothetical protein